MLKHYIASFWARNLTTYRVLFSYTTWFKNYFPLRLYSDGQWHSSLDPQFIWISPWIGWKASYVEKQFMLKHYLASFLERNLTPYRVLFCITPRSKILSLSDFSQTVTLIPRPSIHLKKSLTRLKNNLCWNTIKRVFEREIWQLIEYFFPIPPRSKILSLSDCTWIFTFLPRPSIDLNTSPTMSKSNLCWNTI